MDDIVYIILVNWKGWKDTIYCLESLFRNSYRNYRVIICDNNSNDASLEKISEWAEGRLETFVTKDFPESAYCGSVRIVL